ncbi:MAG: VWA domain-containing protein, partial [Terracidiphilus sp.]
ANGSEPRHTEVILVVSTFDKKGNELKRDAKIIKVNAPPTDPPTGRLHRNLNIPCKIDHNPKAVRVRFSVRSSATGRIGTADYVLGQETKKDEPKP